MGDGRRGEVSDLRSVILKRNVLIETKINVTQKGRPLPWHLAKQQLQGFAALPIINQELHYPKKW